MRSLILASAARFIGGFKLAPLANQWSFHDNEPIDDVSEKFFSYVVNPTSYSPYGYVSGQRIVENDDNYGTNLAIDFAPGQNEPFCIQCKFRLTAINTAYQAGVIARWHDTDTTQRSWGLWIWNDGKIQFSISNDGTDTNVYWLTSAPGLVQMNRNYHVAVERNAANQITIYLDGIAVASGIDGREAYSESTALVAVRRGVLGSVWDMKLSNEVVFGAPFGSNVPGKFGKITETQRQKYTDAIAADIVYQMTGRRSSTVNEKNGVPMVLNKSNMYNGKLFVSNLNGTAYYSAPVDYFGAGDFTLECKLTVESNISGEGLLVMSHWYNGSATNNNNRWIVCILPNGAIQVVFARSAAAGDYTVRATATGTIVQNKRYHIVVERYNGIIKLFVNGVEKLSWSQPEPLWATSGNKISNTFNGSSYAQHRIWDIRIAKRAMYKHVSPKRVESFPKMPVDWRTQKPTHRLIVGSNDVSNGSVTYRGFAKHFLYGTSTISFGELPHELYYNTQTGKVMRIVALVYQTNGHILIALKESSEPYVQGMPTMTNKIKIAGGPTVDFDLGIALPAATDPTIVAREFGINNVANWATAFATDETEVSFSFV